MNFTQEQKHIKVQRKSNLSKQNSTGIPLQMKNQYEKLSGFSFDDICVHYNSDKPVQFQALAYTQGNQVFIGPGQETHLGHELGHAVQQKQGRVRATQQIGNTAINNDTALEREADYTGKRADTLTNISAQLISSGEVPIQRMAIRAQEPPKGQEDMFTRLESAAIITEGVGSTVIKAGTVPSTKVNGEENIAFMGHGSPNKIGDLEPDDIVQNIENVIIENVVDGKKDTDWIGKVFLMGCNTGRAYRDDESKELDDNNKSLADKVEQKYNTRFVKPISDVVGTFLQIQAPSIILPLFEEVKAEESLTTITGDGVKEVMEEETKKTQKQLTDNQELVIMVRKFTAYSSLYQVYNTLTDVFYNTNEAKMFRPLDDSLSSCTPREIRDEIVEFMRSKLIDKVKEFRDLILTFTSIPVSKKNIMTKYLNALGLIHKKLREEMNAVIINEKYNNIVHIDLPDLSEEKSQLKTSWGNFNQWLTPKVFVDFRNSESTYHTAKAKMLAVTK